MGERGWDLQVIVFAFAGAAGAAWFWSEEGSLEWGAAERVLGWRRGGDAVDCKIQVLKT